MVLTSGCLQSLFVSSRVVFVPPLKTLFRIGALVQRAFRRSSGGLPCDRSDRESSRWNSCRAEAADRPSITDWVFSWQLWRGATYPKRSHTIRQYSKGIAASSVGRRIEGVRESCCVQRVGRVRVRLWLPLSYDMDEGSTSC